MLAIIIIIILIIIKVIHIFPGMLSFLAFSYMGSIGKYFLSLHWMQRIALCNREI